MPNTTNQILNALNFLELISTHFLGEKNAMGWQRHLKGNFAEIISKIEVSPSLKLRCLKGEENIIVISEEDLNALPLSEEGQIAREIILNDLILLRDFGAAPVLNLIRYYERDQTFPFFPTDVYSFHVDRSPIPTSTFLCTYYGASSEILPNWQAEQKIVIPEIRQELKKQYDGKDENFDSFLREHFFDLHYQAKPNAQPIPLGIGNLWRLAVDHPESKCLPCIHRAPIENKDEPRLLLIC